MVEAVMTATNEEAGRIGLVDLASAEARDPGVCGPKAATPAKLLASGHEVPRGFVLTSALAGRCRRHGAASIATELRLAGQAHRSRARDPR